MIDYLVDQIFSKYILKK